jgi:hypothetical protein
MSGFTGRYLRVLTPQTVDGINLEYDEDNKIVYKESHQEPTARKYFEQENMTRPKQLKHILEDVGLPKPVARKQ